MKPQANPADNSGLSNWQRLDAAFRKVLTVPKDELLKEEARLKAEKQKKRESKKPH